MSIRIFILFLISVLSGNLTLISHSYAQDKFTNQTEQKKENSNKVEGIGQKNMPQNNDPTIQNTTWIANIVRSNSPHIEGLEISQSQLPIVSVKSGQRFRPMVEIPVTFSRKGWNLFVQGTVPVTPTSDPIKYSVFAYMNSRVNELQLVAKGPQKNQKETETIYIYAPEAQEYAIVTPWDAVRLSIGNTYLRFRQTSQNDFYSWNGFVDIQTHSAEESGKYGYLVEANVSALTFTSNQNNYGPQVLNAFADGIYFYPWVSNSLWRHQILAGLNITSVFSNGSPFGINNLIAPEVGYRTRYLIDEKRDWVAEIRLLPMSTKLDFQEGGISLSIGHSWILQNLHRAELGFKFFNIQYKPTLFDNVNLQTMSLMFSYSL